MITLLALALFTLLCLLMAPGHAWDNLTVAERNTLVFQGRHQAYGAYRLRRRYERHLAVAMLATLGLIASVAVAARYLAMGARPAPPVTRDRGIVVDFSRVFIPPPEPPVQHPQPAAAPPVAHKATPAGQMPRMVEATDAITPPVIPAVDSTQSGPGAAGDGTDMAAGGGPAGPGGDGAGAGTGAVDGLGTRTYDGFDVQELPAFPGGEAGLKAWVDRNLGYFPGSAGREEVFVQFTVMPDGSVRDVKAVKGRNKAFREAAERALRRMPRWKAARVQGHEVPCRLTLPIRMETR